MDSAHKNPEFGHSCRALAIIDKAISLTPVLNSTRIASSHNNSFLGFFKRALSRTERALVSNPRFSSNLAKSNQSEIEFGHFLI